MLVHTDRLLSFRYRFDSNGRGLGLSGRRDYRDLPALWPTPPSDDSGLLGYLPSLLGTLFNNKLTHSNSR
jgi:hypothetical protein